MATTNLVTLFIFAFALLAIFANAVQAGDAAKARRDLMFAKNNAESERWDDLDSAMKKVAADMEGLSDAEKAPLLPAIAEIKEIVTKSVEEEVTKRLDKAAKAEGGMGKLDIDRATMRVNSDEAKNYGDPARIDKLKAKIAGMTGGSAPANTTPTEPPRTTTTPPTTPGKMSDELAMAVAKARSARNIMAQASGIQDYQMAESFMREANKRLDAIQDPAKAPFVADMMALGKEIDEANLKWQKKEEFDRIDGQVHRYVTDAESGIEPGVVGFPDRLNKAQELLNGENVKRYMDAEHTKAYQAKIDSLRVKFRENNKAAALQRSADTLKELEEKVAADPFKGVDDGSTYKVYNELKSLSDRVRGEFIRVPKDDPEIKAVLARVDAADAKMEASASKYALQHMEEQFASSWKFTSQGFEGWEAEILSPESVKNRRVEGLNKTTQAISGTVYWLNSADTKQTLEKYKTDAAVLATVAAAHKTLDDASAKLNASFNLVIADAEHQPMPRRESDRASIGYLGHDAEHWFTGTKYKEANVARAMALDAKWKADVERMKKEMAETLKKLTAAADAAWPKIEGSVNAERGFDPSAMSQWKGKTIIIKGYWNRTGWDFDAAWDFAVDIKGVPVAGNYEPNVREAFNEGSRHTEFGIDDHVGWDLIAVVEGPGQIKRRTTTEWKDKDTHEIIMKTETYVPEPCVVLKVIGLRAGPVAVGPK